MRDMRIERLKTTTKYINMHVKCIKMVDLFPHSRHVEAIILMTRSGSGEKK